jgi:hypothetical protein
VIITGSNYTSETYFIADIKIIIYQLKTIDNIFGTSRDTTAINARNVKTFFINTTAQLQQKS